MHTRADETIPEEMAPQYSLPIRGSSSKPKGLMSGDTAQYTPAQVAEPSPNQAIPSNTAQAPPPFIDLSHDQKEWDTIVVCCLLSKLFGRPMSPAEIAKAINFRDQHTAAPIDPNSVDCMSQGAQSDVQRLYSETCGYKKWEGVRDRLAARDGVRDGDDKEMEEAFALFCETLRILNFVESSGMM